MRILLLPSVLVGMGGARYIGRDALENGLSRGPSVDLLSVEKEVAVSMHEGMVVMMQLGEEPEANKDQVQGRIELNGVMTDVDCDCSENWKTDMSDVKTLVCTKPTKFKIKREDVVGEHEEDLHMSASNVREFLGVPSQLNYVSVDETSLNDIDGRTTAPIIGTPGGDAGEFVAALQVYSDLLGVSLDEKDVHELLLGYLNAIKPRRFYMHSSADAVDSLQVELNVEGIGLLTPRADPPELKEMLLGKCAGNMVPPCGLMAVNNVGDAHLKLMMKHPGIYMVDNKTIQSFIHAFFTILWDMDPAVSSMLSFEALPSSRVSNEKAVLNIMVSEGCAKEKKVPLIIPRTTSESVFVNHVDAVDIRRQELAKYFSALSNDLVKTEVVLARLQKHGIKSYEATISRLTKGLPVYNVIIE